MRGSARHLVHARRASAPGRVELALSPSLLSVSSYRLSISVIRLVDVRSELPPTPVMRDHPEARGKDVWRAEILLGRDDATGQQNYLTRTIHGTKRQADKSLQPTQVRGNLLRTRGARRLLRTGSAGRHSAGPVAAYPGRTVSRANPTSESAPASPSQRPATPPHGSPGVGTDDTRLGHRPSSSLGRVSLPRPNS